VRNRTVAEAETALIEALHTATHAHLGALGRPGEHRAAQDYRRVYNALRGMMFDAEVADIATEATRTARLDLGIADDEPDAAGESRYRHMLERGHQLRGRR